MKKIIALCVVVLLFMGVTAFADEGTALVAQGVISEDKTTVTVTVKVTSSADICGCSFNFVYDDKAFDIVKIEKGEVIASSTVMINENYAENTVRIVSASAQKLPSFGTVITVVFSVKDPSADCLNFAIEKQKIMGEDGLKIASTSKNAQVILKEKDSENVFVPSPGINKEPASTPELPEEDHEVFLMSFTDVNEKDWFYDSVKYVRQNGLMNGVSDSEFAPDSTLTRAMLVTVLYRMEKEPACGDVPFTDVAPNTWYTKAIAWAYENKIVNGVGNNKFSPNTDITREQIAVILFNYARYKKADTSGTALLGRYADADGVSDWALDAMGWAVHSGLITGRTENTLEAAGNATRAEAATVIMRFINKTEK